MWDPKLQALPLHFWEIVLLCMFKEQKNKRKENNKTKQNKTKNPKNKTKNQPTQNNDKNPNTFQI